MANKANKLSLNLATVFIILSFVLCLVGFGTGSWWVSIDEDSTFDRAGLWEICFNGYEHTSDLIGKAYYGCWWVFYKEYYYIRDWILPGLYIALQSTHFITNISGSIFAWSANRLRSLWRPTVMTTYESE